MKLHLEEKREDDIPPIEGMKKICFSAQVREGNFRFSDALISEHAMVVSSCAWAVPRNASSWMWYNFHPAGMSSFLMTRLLTPFVQINSYHKITESQLSWKEPTRITESNPQTCTGPCPRVFSLL